MRRSLVASCILWNLSWLDNCASWIEMIRFQRRTNSYTFLKHDYHLSRENNQQLMKENKLLKIRNNMMIKYFQGFIIDIQDYYIFIKYNAFQLHIHEEQWNDCADGWIKYRNCHIKSK